MRDYAIVLNQETTEISVPPEGYEHFYREREFACKINELVRVVNGLARIVNEYEQERAKKIDI